MSINSPDGLASPDSLRSPGPSPQATFKGRWGYYPCGYDTWRVLRRLRFQWFATACRLAAWERWDAKQPQNRIVKRRVRRDGRPVGWKVLGPRPEPVLPAFMIEQQWGRRRLAHGWIETSYREAKHPTPQPREVWDEAKVRQIADLAGRVEAWFGVLPSDPGVKPRGPTRSR